MLSWINQLHLINPLKHKVTTIQAEQTQFQNQCIVQKKIKLFIKQNKWKRNLNKCILFDTLYNNYDKKQK